jgi:hypothetical protein
VSSSGQMPEGKTQRGRDCLRDFQYEHALCVGTCGGSAEVLPEKSRSQCNQKLEDCHERCVEDETCRRKDFG